MTWSWWVKGQKHEKRNDKTTARTPTHFRPSNPSKAHVHKAKGINLQSRQGITTLLHRQCLEDLPSQALLGSSSADILATLSGSVLVHAPHSIVWNSSTKRPVFRKLLQSPGLPTKSVALCQNWWIGKPWSLYKRLDSFSPSRSCIRLPQLFLN